jgi:hypothetical protein
MTTQEIKEVIGRLENIRDELSSLTFYDEEIEMYGEMHEVRPAIEQMNRLIEDLNMIVYQQELKELDVRN